MLRRPPESFVFYYLHKLILRKYPKCDIFIISVRHKGVFSLLTAILDKTIPVPLYEQLYKEVRNRIKGGELKAGEKLPSKRKLALHLGVSQLTVQNAYAQLIAEGYVHAVPKSGYYVEDMELPPSAPEEAPPLPQESPVKPTAFQYAFETNAVDTNAFPFATWARFARRVLSGSSDILNASHPQGVYALRREIAGYLYRFRGIRTTPEQIVLGAGSEYLFAILIQLLGRDSLFALEEPGYHKIGRILDDHDIRTVSIPLDTGGMQVPLLRRSKANIVHISPSHQFPTGIVMPVSRRLSLLKWAEEEKNRYIIESDYDSEFRFCGNPLPACRSLEGSGRVIYLNTFTKSLAPSLRINYMVLPPELLALYRSRYMHYACTVPNFEQYILCEFLRSGTFERHLSRMCKLYRKKRDLLTAAVQESALAGQIEFAESNAGLHLLLRVRIGRSESELVTDAAAHGIRIRGISEYYRTKPPEDLPPTLVVGYSGLQTEEIIPAVQALMHAWEDTLSQ